MKTGKAEGGEPEPDLRAEAGARRLDPVFIKEYRLQLAVFAGDPATRRIVEEFDAIRETRGWV